MLSKILIVLLGLIAAAAGLVAMQPATYSVTRTQTIAAPPAEVYAAVSDFHRWEAWSPWAKLDPAMKVTYEGSPAGTGAIYRWAGNDEAGEGMMTILESKPAEAVKIDLRFIKPFESAALTEFRITPDGANTKVDWTMSGDNNFMSKAFSLVMGGMDKMVGPDFEKGLKQMKAAVEGAAKK